MKKYIKPSIEVMRINATPLLQASNLNDETAGGDESLGRRGFFEDEEEE